MKAVVHRRYGPPEILRVEDVAQPVPADDEVLIRVRATTVNRTDCGFRQPEPFIVRFFSGLLRPKRPILGTELAGEVEAVGASVRDFAVGDRVFGVNAGRFGAHAEYVCMPEQAPLATMPDGVGFEEAAAVYDGAIIALSCLRSAEPLAGRDVLVYGASGSIGTAAVQLASHLGARVTAVCTGKSLKLVRSLGAEEAIDYTQHDYTRNGKRYDVIFDAVGKHSFRRSRRSLRPGGTFLETDLGFLWHVPILALLTRRIGDKTVTLAVPKYTKENVRLLNDLIAAGSYRAVIDRTYPLEDVVEATRYVESEHKIGNVVLTVGPTSTETAWRR
jgi:NADPH:quinone reductase-like Zn-dependent oxidoreductase